MNEHQFRHLLDEYLQGKCAPEEVVLLHQFYDSFQKEALEDEPDVLDMWLWEEKTHRNIEQRIAHQERQQYEEQRLKAAKSRTLLQTVASMLVVISLGIGSYVSYINMPAPAIVWMEKSTRKGQKATIRLTDGTKVYLNADSKISFPEHFDPDKREVILEGEAFFDVARDVKRPFTIKSGDLTTTVLGTSFNIKAFKEEPLHVTVVTGKVKVNAHDRDGTSKEVFLNPYQQAFYDGQLSKKEVDVDQYIAWREKVILFDEVSLQKAAIVLERWFNVSINIENEDTRQCKISGKYINENLINIMESFEHILDIEYQIEGQRKITIEGKGCNGRPETEDRSAASTVDSPPGPKKKLPTPDS